MNEDTKAARFYKDALEVLNTIENAGYEARLAGGCVRDRLLGILPNDYDVATTSKPEETCAIFEQKGHKVVPTGIAFGTVTVVMPSGPVEVTTLRTDIDSDGRHAKVDFAADFKEDAARRGFTINAMSEDAAGQVYDYFLGRKDLENRFLRFVGNTEERIREDYLRIMRFFRFWARFELTPDKEALVAFGKHATGLDSISQERKIGELLGLLKASDPSLALAEMWKCGVLQHTLDSLAKKPEPFVTLGDSFPAQQIPIVRLFQLCDLHNFSAKKQSVQKTLKLSSLHVRWLGSLKLEQQHLPSTDDTAAVLEFIQQRERKLPRGSVQQVHLPFWSAYYPGRKAELEKIESIETKHGHRRHKQIPFNGRDLEEAFNIPAGPETGRLLNLLKMAFYRGHVTTRREAEEFLRKLVEKSE